MEKPDFDQPDWAQHIFSRNELIKHVAERPRDMSLAVTAPSLGRTADEMAARAEMIKRFGNPEMLPEVPYPNPAPAPDPIEVRVQEKTRLRQEILEGEQKLRELDAKIAALKAAK